MVLLDTSILLRLAEAPSPFLEELSDKLGKVELAVPTPVIRELLQLSRSKGGKGRAARLALAYSKPLTKVECEGEADDALLLLAQSKSAMIATLDLELIGRSRRRGIPVATLRDERLQISGPLI